MPDRHGKFPGCFPDCRFIKTPGKTISPPVAHMAASAGTLIHQIIPLSFLCPITQGETDKFSRTQPSMGDVLTL